jgi:hypothetical protein
MSENITQRVLAMAVALGMTAACVGIIGSAVAQSPFQHAQFIQAETLTSPPVSETDFRLGDHQLLRKHFLGN